MQTISNTLQNWKGILGPYKLPIGDDGSGNQIYLDMQDLFADALVCIYCHDEIQDKE